MGGCRRRSRREGVGGGGEGVGGRGLRVGGAVGARTGARGKAFAWRGRMGGRERRLEGRLEGLCGQGRTARQEEDTGHDAPWPERAHPPPPPGPRVARGRSPPTGTTPASTNGNATTAVVSRPPLPRTAPAASPSARKEEAIEGPRARCGPHRSSAHLGASAARTRRPLHQPSRHLRAPAGPPPPPPPASWRAASVPSAARGNPRPSRPRTPGETPISPGDRQRTGTTPATRSAP